MIGRPYAVLFFFGRQSLVIAAIGFAARLRCGARELSPLLRASAMLALLWCTGVLMVASDTLDPYSDHATLLVLLHVLGYGVLVPPLLARHVLALFTSLLGFGLALQRRFPSPGQPLWPALVHGVVVNCVGFSLAFSPRPTAATTSRDCSGSVRRRGSRFLYATACTACC